MNNITKITLAIFAIVTVATYGVNVASAIVTPPEVENTLTLCSDGVDNDFNGTSDLSDPSCAEFVPVAETTYELCSDSKDNDFNGTSDLSDPSCVAFVPVTENTAELCSDSKDNDFNGTSDLGDPSCIAFVPVATSTATTTTPTDSGNGGGTTTGGGATAISGGGFSIPTGLPVGQSVLGASTGPGTTTCPYLTTYMKMGKKNDKGDVTRLQMYLNSKYDAKIPVTGFFGKLTKNAVISLQTLKSNEILKPWVDAGLMAFPRSTGYVYKTTQWYINNEMCPSYNYPIPELK